MVYPVDNTDGVSRALDQARSADLVVKASGVGVFDALLEARVPAITAAGRSRRLLGRRCAGDARPGRGGSRRPFRALIPAYDMVLTYGGGPPVVAGYKRFGARSCVPIYNALDPATHHPVPPEPRFACDLGLLANRLPDRERRIEEFFLAVAADLPNSGFLLGGTGWADKPMPPNVGYLGHVYTRDHNAFNCVGARGAERQPRQHGVLRLHPGDARVRGGRRRRLHHHRRVGRHRPNSSSRAGRSWSPATGRPSPSISRGSTAARLGGSARRRALARSPSTPTTQRVDVLEAALEGRAA